MFRPKDAQASLGFLQDEMNRMFERFWHTGVATGPFDGQAWGPCVDAYEFEDRYVLYFELPGVDESEAEVSVLGHTLTVRGEKSRPAAAEEAVDSLQGERRFGSFCRSVDLPEGIDSGGVRATCSKGVLEVTVPKTETSRPKSIRIDVEES